MIRLLRCVTLALLLPTALGSQQPAFTIEQVRAIKVCGAIDASASVIGDSAAGCEDATFGVMSGKFEPHIEAIDCTCREEVSDFSGARLWEPE